MRTKEGAEPRLRKKRHGRHLQLVEAVQSREGPIGVLYCARDVVMVQLPVEREGKEGDEKERRKEKRAGLCQHWSITQSGLEVMG